LRESIKRCYAEDTLLRLAEFRLYRVAWSAGILEEIVAAILEDDRPGPTTVGS
jgi:hypothetical protein